MWPPSRPGRWHIGRRGLAGALVVAVGLGGGSAAAEPLLLDVIINGRPIGQLGEFESQAGALSATRREIGALGLQPGDGAPDERVALGALPGVSARLDGGRQAVEITAAAAALTPVQLGRPAVPRSDLAIESGWGAVLDYDAIGTFEAGRSRAQTLFDGRVFSPFGLLSSQAIAGTGAGTTGAVRLDTTYTYSDPETLRRVRVGDVISSGLAWTRPLRLGGGQVARDFGLRPDLITIPVPTIAGQVAVPSSVDVLINGTQLLSTQAEPGPFELRRLPVVNGVNDVAVVINNAVGQQVVQSAAIYTGAALLAPGLQAYSVEAGAVRLGYGLRSADYRVPAVSASYRRGLTDWLTVSGHTEGSASLVMGGVGVAAAIGSLAIGSVAVAGSTFGRSAGGGTGLLAYGGIERISPTFSFSASAQWTDGQFGDLASLYADPVPNNAIRASAGRSFGRFGTVAVAYTRQRRSAYARAPLFSTVGTGYGGPLSTGRLSAPAFYLPIRTALLTASYSAPLPFAAASFYATAYHDFDNRSSNGLLFGITLPLGDRSSVSVGAGRSDGVASGTVQASRSVVAVGDVGGQFYSTQGGTGQTLATGRYKSAWSLLELSAYHSGKQTAWRGAASGALVLAGGDMFASNLIPDSFAIVDTTGQAGVNVRYENRTVERTGSSGRVLVPDLRSYEENRLSIDTEGLPLDVELGPTLRVVRPADRSGVVVRFDMRRRRAALLRLVDGQDRPLPVGTTLHLDGGGAPIPVGYGGEAFVLDLPAQARLRADLPGRGSCQVAFDYRPVEGDIPTIGPLRCVSR